MAVVVPIFSLCWTLGGSSALGLFVFCYKNQLILFYFLLYVMLLINWDVKYPKGGKQGKVVAQLNQTLRIKIRIGHFMADYKAISYNFLSIHFSRYVGKDPIFIFCWGRWVETQTNMQPSFLRLFSLHIIRNDVVNIIQATFFKITKQSNSFNLIREDNSIRNNFGSDIDGMAFKQKIGF